MTSSPIRKYAAAFFNILFLRPYGEQVRACAPAGRALLFALAALFYGPMIYSLVIICGYDSAYIPYCAWIVALHALARLLLSGSKRVQNRFSGFAAGKRPVTRIRLAIEYILFMWLVYLFYPICCILFPAGLLAVFVEQMLGANWMFEAFLHNTESFIFFGSMAAYVLFIFADGFRRLRSGLMPEYLSLYAVFMAGSGLLGNLVQQNIPHYIPADVLVISDMLSWVFTLSNRALSMVSSTIVFVFAFLSLYRTCGTGIQAAPPEQEQEAEMGEEEQASM